MSRSFSVLSFALASCCVALVAGCPDADQPRGSGGSTPTGGSSSGGVAELPPVDECAGIDCLPCASGTQCADASAFIDGTCCAKGDSLVHLGSGSGSEVVDIESDGKYAYLCGGFGVAVSKVVDPTKPGLVGAVSQRCQHAAIGPVLGDGSQIFYLTHHGDSWVDEPFIATYRITPEETIAYVDQQTEPGVLYEGSAWHDGRLYVAAHGGGLRVYATGPDGVPSFESVLGGFDNAWKLAIVDGVAYVVDATVGLSIVSLVDPQSPIIVATVPTTGQPRDVAVSDGRVFVALGGFGVDVFDATTPDDLVPIGHIDTQGSAQAVAADAGALAVAAWSHVAVYDAATLLLTGTEKLHAYPDFEQDLGVAMVGDMVYVGEWEGLHTLRHRPGFVAPDLWLDEQMVQFTPDEIDVRAVVVRNRGRLTLSIDASVSDLAFAVDTSNLAIAPGGAAALEVGYLPTAASTESFLHLATNDPDPSDAAYRAALLTSDSALIDVGDAVSAEFAFLDPSGAGQLSGLDGHVIVLAYFALF